MTSTLEKVRAKIIEAVPEIMEPQIGSRVVWTYQHALNTTARTPVSKEGVILGFHGSTRLVRVHIDHQKSTKDILLDKLHVMGRPITLADVLRTISDPRVIVTSHRMEFRFEGEAQAYWDHTKSLDEQEPEVIEFLGKVLRV